MGKHGELQLVYLFARLHLLSSHFFFSLILSLLRSDVLTPPTSAFPSVHIVGNYMPKPDRMTSIYK